jgi:hypothetical protein
MLNIMTKVAIQQADCEKMLLIVFRGASMLQIHVAIPTIGIQANINPTIAHGKHSA